MRRGIGRALLAALIENFTALGFRQMVAVICDIGNAAPDWAKCRCLARIHVKTIS